MYRLHGVGVYKTLLVKDVILMLNAEKFTAFTDSILLLFKLFKI